MRDREGVDLDGSGGGKELRELERRERLIRIYYVRKNIYFQYWRERLSNTKHVSYFLCLILNKEKKRLAEYLKYNICQ